ncbi:MAG: hypothetical protein WCK78_03125 [Paludibacter sp.]
MKKHFALAMICFIAASMQAKIYYVTADATTVATVGIASGWNNPVTLASTISIATSATDSIWVKSGTYFVDRGTTTTGTPPVTTANRAAILINSGVKQIFGGFAGTETMLNQRLRSDLDGNGIIEPWEFSNQTILDGANMSDYPTAVTSRKDIYATGAPTLTGSWLVPNKKTIISIEGSANHIVDGVVVQNGKYDGDSYASGIYISVAAHVRNSIVRKCSITRKDDLTNGGSISSGAAVSITNALAVVDACLIEDNTAGPLMPGAYTSGAGVCVSQGTLSNSLIRNNLSSVRSATAAGAGFAAGELTNLGLTAPTTVQNGNLRAAGVYISGSGAGKRAPLVINCVVANNEGVSYDPNSASSYASGITVDGCGVVMNSTVVNNKISFVDLNSSITIPTTALEGIGIYVRPSATYTTTTPALVKNNISSIYNCIVLGNQGTAATLATKADISLKTNVAYAPNEAAASVTNASTLLPFGIMEVKNCMVGGSSINCDPLSSNATVVGNDNILSASVTFATAQKTMTQTIPSGCVFSQTTAILNTPSTLAGYSATDASIKTANWRLKDATYTSGGTAVNTQWTNYNSTNVGTVYTYSSPATDMLGNIQGTSPTIGALFNTGNHTAVNTVSAEKTNFYKLGNTIYTTEAVPTIAIYNTAGMCVGKVSNTNSISIEEFHSGIYIVVAGNNRLKFVK